jgi:pimeloyl-ACP methyl ester carboxylesterase
VTRAVSVPIIASCLFASACTSVPRPDTFRATSAVWPTPSHAAAEDGRARFREVFCELVARAGDERGARNRCGALLWQLADEPHADAPAAPAPELLPGLRVFVVSGAFGDCRGKDTIPYDDAIERLAAAGVRIQAVMVSGRSSAERNAAQLAEAIRDAHVADDERIVLVGYSKGAVDSLQFLVDFPDLARNVAAVVSVAGPIYGSPLAATADGWYRHLFSQSFKQLCDPGDGGVIESLLPDKRRRWLDEHRLPPHVRYYSIAAFPTRKHLAWGLESSWQLLAPDDPRNDGQVLIEDALIPGSTLLGYTNADHWDIAIAVERQMPVFSGRKSARTFPRDALFEAMLRYVGESLPAVGAVNGGPAAGR